MIIRPIKKEEMSWSLDFVYEVFKATNYTDGHLERRLVEEIRQEAYYIPELDMVAEEDGHMIGHFILSKFPINGQHVNEMLLLSPVSVAIDKQRQGIGLEMLKQGLERAKAMGYKGVIVEGNPKFYGHLGFRTSTEFGIYASEKNLPPKEEYLMAMPLCENGLEQIKGEVDYSIYKTLT